MGDKPYLEENATIAFLIEWGGYVLFLLLVLSPFIYLWFRRKRGISWGWVVGVYLTSFLLAWFTVYGWTFVDDIVAGRYINYGWVSQALDSVVLKSWMTLLFLWSLSTFYIAWLKYGALTAKWFLVSFAVAILFFLGLAVLSIYGIMWALGQIGMEHF